MNRGILTYLAVLLVCLAFCAPSSRGDTGQLSEAQVKVGYLYNFAKFAEWPAAGFPSAGAPFVLCVLGKNPFGEAVSALSGRTVHNHKIQVRLISRPEEAAGCQLLFISDSEKRRLRRILSDIPAQGVLTVSDSNDFARQGGGIGLVSEGARVRFEINPANTEHSGVKLSSQLLKLAILVHE